MSKFCPNCGNALADNAMFCGSCGAKQETAPTQPPVQTAEPIYQQPAEPMYQQPAEPMYQQFDYAPPTQPKKSKKGLVIGLAVAAIAVAAALFIFLSGGKDKPYSKALDNYLNTQCMMECDDIKSLMPQEVWDDLEDYEDEGPSDYKEYIRDNHDDYVEELEYDYGTNLKFSYKVTEEEALSASELEDIRYNLEMDYNMDSSSVKKGYKLDVDVTIKGSEDSDTEEMELIAIQIGSKWYIGEPDEWDDMLYISFIFW